MPRIGQCFAAPPIHYRCSSHPIHLALVLRQRLKLLQRIADVHIDLRLEVDAGGDIPIEKETFFVTGGSSAGMFLPGSESISLLTILPVVGVVRAGVVGPVVRITSGWAQRMALMTSRRTSSESINNSSSKRRNRTSAS